MAAITIASITFILTFTAFWVGTLVRSRLPNEHTAKESQDVVRLGMGLVATMTALLLGLVTAGAKSTFDQQDAAIRSGAVNILTLDRHLARYGPEAAPIREHVRAALDARIQSLWSTKAGGAAPTTTAEDIQSEILHLAPQTEDQRWFKGEALKLTEDLLKTRWRLLSSRSGAVPRAFIAVVVFWLMATFASFGLYAPRNGTVLSVLFIASVSVAAAVFLILELDGPLEGIIKVSAEPLRYALTQIGR
jgi:hypothetical protein